MGGEISLLGAAPAFVQCPNCAETYSAPAGERRDCPGCGCNYPPEMLRTPRCARERMIEPCGRVVVNVEGEALCRAHAVAALGPEEPSGGEICGCGYPRDVHPIEGCAGFVLATDEQLSGIVEERRARGQVVHAPELAGRKPARAASSRADARAQEVAARAAVLATAEVTEAEVARLLTSSHSAAELLVYLRGKVKAMFVAGHAAGVEDCSRRGARRFG